MVWWTNQQRFCFRHVDIFDGEQHNMEGRFLWEPAQLQVYGDELGRTPQLLNRGLLPFLWELEPRRAETYGWAILDGIERCHPSRGWLSFPILSVASSTPTFLTPPWYRAKIVARIFALSGILNHASWEEWNRC